MKSNLYLRSCFSSASPLTELDESTLSRMEDQLAQQQRLANEQTTLRHRPTYRVLIVEDNADVARSLKMNFERAGVQAYVAQNCIRIQDIFCAHTPHLVLMNLTTTGIETEQICGDMRLLCDVPIMFVTNAINALHRTPYYAALDSAAPPAEPQMLVARAIAHLRKIYRYEDGHIYRKQDMVKEARNGS